VTVVGEQTLFFFFDEPSSGGTSGRRSRSAHDLPREPHLQIGGVIYPRIRQRAAPLVQQSIIEEAMGADAGASATRMICLRADRRSTSTRSCSGSTTSFRNSEAEVAAETERRYSRLFSSFKGFIRVFMVVGNASLSGRWCDRRKNERDGGPRADSRDAVLKRPRLPPRTI